MGIKQGTQAVPIDTLRINAFSGGMNTSASPRDIEPNEASLIENFEFDDLDNLVTRNGLTHTQSFLAVSGIASGIFSFNTESGFIGVMYPTDISTLHSYSLSGTPTNITGALTLPANAKWYWKSLANVAVGVNGSPAPNANPVRVVGPAPGTPTAHPTAPRGKYIEEWRSRLFISQLTVSGSPNRVQYSDLGSADNWNLGGLTNPSQGGFFDVAPGDGDIITALFTFKERLFIFKRKKIYILRAVAIPETDPSNWELVEYSKNVGCISQSSVREVFDDVIFLSEGGLCSLSAAEGTADFASALVSQKISEIQRIKKDAPETSINGISMADRSQYWLLVDSTASPDGRNTIWVMDYKQIRTKGIRWTVFSGLIFPTSIDLYNGGGQSQQTYLMGVRTPASPTASTLCLYRPNMPLIDRVFTDKTTTVDFRAIVGRLNTKAFDFGTDEYRKVLLQWYLRTSVISDKASFKISYDIDEPLEPVVSYLFDTSKSFKNQEHLVRQAFYHGASRKAISVRFSMIVGGKVNQGVSLKNFGIKFGVLSERESESMLINTILKNVDVTIDRNRTITGNIAGGVDLLYNNLLSFDSLKSDGDYVDVLSGGIVATNNNDKSITLQVNGNEITGLGGTAVAPIVAADFDGAAGLESWSIYSRLMRINSTTLRCISKIDIGSFFADGAGAFSNTNGLTKPDVRDVTVPDLNLTDLTIQVICTGVADNDIVHRGTTLKLNQQ